MTTIADVDSSAIVAVKDLAKAKAFYGETLGLKLVDESMNVPVYKTGKTKLVLYESKEAGTNRANAVVWGLGKGLKAEVARLQGKGVTFEHYPEMKDAKFENGIHWSGDFGAAWFKDPDGNILHVNGAI